MKVEVDSGSYTSACDQFYKANHSVDDIMSTLIDVLGGSGSMAGTDSGGETWAGQYDDVAGTLVQAGCDVGSGCGQMANLLNTSLSNHLGADYSSLVYGPPVPGAPADDPNPAHSTITISPATPPSAYGGTGDQPGWWHWISGHLGGLLWPDADTGRLRDTGRAWQTAGSSYGYLTLNIDGASAVMGGQVSSEVADVVATCDTLSAQVTTIATAFHDIGQACLDYADQVDQHHQEIEDELKSFVEWTIGIEAGGAILGALSFGLGEVAAQAAEGAKVAEAAAKVIAILNRLIEAARLVSVRIGELVAKVGDVSVTLKGLLGARTIKAVEETGEVLAKEEPFIGEGVGFTADGAINPADFKTDPDSAFFWSGRTGDVGGPDVAGKIAGEGNGTTLEQLMEERGIKMPEWDADNPASVRAWTQASEAYADGASGEVRAVIGDSVRPNAVWNVERQALMDNPAVTKITTIDPATGKATVIYP